MEKEKEGRGEKSGWLGRKGEKRRAECLGGARGGITKKRRDDGEGLSFFLFGLEEEKEEEGKKKNKIK